MTGWEMALIGSMALVAGGAGRSKLDAAEDPRLRYTGRWAQHEGEMVTINSGSVLEAAFKGGRCVLYFDVHGLTEKPQVWLQFDGGMPQKKTVDAKVEVSVGGKPQATHILKLTVKAVEEHQRNWQHLEGAVKLIAIETDGGLQTLPKDDRPLVEFVGDSITAGVLLGPDGSTTERMDGLNAYPSVAGARLDVRVSQVGFGRLGTTVVGNGEVPLAHESFGFCFAGAPITQNPAMVVLNMGTNDRRNTDDGEFAAAYRNYLATVRKTYPDAAIVCLSPFGGFHADTIEAEVAHARTAGDQHISYINTTGWLDKDDYTDGIHPNAQGHRKAGEKLADALRPLMKR